MNKSQMKVLFTGFILILMVFTPNSLLQDGSEKTYQTDKNFQNGEHLNLNLDSFQSTTMLDDSPISSSTETESSFRCVVVFVNSTLYESSSVQLEIGIYMEDLVLNGYNPILHTSPISTVESLREILQNLYSTANIEGGVLIGEFPFAEFLDKDIIFGGVFICELFLMDLDGNWVDNDDDGVYDYHSATYNTDILPEIYIGRIDASRRNFGGKTEEEDIVSFLNRTHAYNTGEIDISRSDRGLLFVDDEWEAWAPEWIWALEKAYSNITCVSDANETTAEEWASKLSEDYEFAHLCVHSSPTTHYFREDAEYNPLDNTEIESIQPGFNFYVLYACSAADFATYDCMTNTYLFSGARSMSVISSSKTGGMLSLGSFYESLNLKYSIGQSFYRWFQNIKTYVSNYLQWFYGMQIHGNPFVYIDYDSTVPPVEITSTTNPNQTQWTDHTQCQLNWTEPQDVNEIVGYYYVIDQNPNTKPTEDNAIFTTINGTEFNINVSGTTYLHVTAIDSLGNINNIGSHFALNIDLELPKISYMSLYDQFYCSTREYLFNWTVDDLSGYTNATVWLDTRETIMYEGVGNAILLENLNEGSHVLNLTVQDLLGYQNSEEFSFYVDLTDPIIDIEGDNEGKLTIKRLEETLTWVSEDHGSGVAFVDIFINGTFNITLNYPLNHIVFSEIFTETKFKNIPLEIVVYDKSGHNSSDQVLVTLKRFNIPGFKINLIGVCSFISIVVIVQVFRKKRKRNFG